MATKISAFNNINYSSMFDSDKVTGIHNGDNANFQLDQLAQYVFNAIRSDIERLVGSSGVSDNHINSLIDAKMAGYTLPVASGSVLGGVKVGSGLSIDSNGVLSVSGGASPTTPIPSDIYESEPIYDDWKVLNTYIFFVDETPRPDVEVEYTPYFLVPKSSELYTRWENSATHWLPFLGTYYNDTESDIGYGVNLFDTLNSDWFVQEYLLVLSDAGVTVPEGYAVGIVWRHNNTGFDLNSWVRVVPNPHV